MPVRVRRNKHVRFAYENIFHSPPATPLMPALTFSLSTASSSASAITPPSSVYSLPSLSSSPRAGYYIPNKAASLDDSEVPRPHPFLGLSAIEWDLIDHPSTISRRNPSVSTRAWKEPATNPTLPFICITIPNFPWKFNVYASTHPYVTCEDVIEKIYHSLRKNITRSDFHSSGSLNDQRRATRAYEERYRRQISNKLYEEEKRGGMKRIDFLMERTRFSGLSNYRRAHEWQLNVT